MAYAIVIVILVVIGVGLALLARRRRNKGLRYAYVPSPSVLEQPLVNLKQVAPVALPTPEVATEEIVERDFRGDEAEDLLDPHNPHHTEWVHEHPGLETDEEWLADHPEDTPK